MQGCKGCGKTKPLRKCSQLCYGCHYKSSVSNECCEDADKTRVREAYFTLASSWHGDNPEREELAAWALIEAVEDLLGKE